ncbi:hypothetical protein POE73_000793 [Enterobacter bugandensis]|uniref:hypothetical protein n=1 Tax=Enterobacter TaxID=547 RepID=UPI00186812C5|nr:MULTISPECIES: hypothetical protein [Enterobacter]EKS7114519.1 hypothetical protein [Enterobacter bugandensis]MBE3464055.1 hypothetical protein [Enterobacter cloacae complex sp. P20C]MBE3472576.1 hypothetical protein [Enterobacter cloacae complex sp. P20B]MBE3494928.1 hypothetical protein [Enterobacter cloacae complex sp. P17RS]MBE3507140.1 hypothetical protein [Enterobacter cloacae complex sp. I10]
MASKPVQNITRESGFFYALHSLAGISLFLPHKRLSLRAVSGSDPPLKQIVPTAGRWRVTTRTKNLSPTKIALHRTRLRFLDHKNFSVLFSYKPDRQTAPVLATLHKTRTEKIEKDFSVFHFYGSLND